MLMDAYDQHMEKMVGLTEKEQRFVIGVGAQLR